MQSRGKYLEAWGSGMLVLAALCNCVACAGGKNTNIPKRNLTMRTSRGSAARLLQTRRRRHHYSMAYVTCLRNSFCCSALVSIMPTLFDLKTMPNELQTANIGFQRTALTQGLSLLHLELNMLNYTSNALRETRSGNSQAALMVALFGSETPSAKKNAAASSPSTSPSSK